MVATAGNVNDNRYQATPGLGFDGVVLVRAGNDHATGVLLADGHTVLTAAHLFAGVADPLAVTEVVFETASMAAGVLHPAQIIIHPGYDPGSDAADLALVRLEQSAWPDAERYTLYRQDDLAGQAFTLVGYGQPGTGVLGESRVDSLPVRRMAGNTVDGDIGLLVDWLGAVMAWDPPAGTQFFADFDSGLSAHDASGRLLRVVDTGLGTWEGLLTAGDSGGPALVAGKVAGIASYTASLSWGGIRPDIDGQGNSSFGEFAAWQKLSYYQQWLDQNLRSFYPDAPVTPEQVQKQVLEGDAGVSYAYFMLSFTGVRSDPASILSVDYTTRDGTATAGEDYLAITDTLKLYPGENQAVIAVEVIGDTRPEPDETFYLDVTNPVGGSFGAGMAMLTAVRTILDDDGLLLG